MDLEFDFASASREATSLRFGRGCFAPGQSVSFTGNMELAWNPGPPAGYALSGSCAGGPMGGASALLLIALNRLVSPLPVSPPGCDLFLDTSSLMLFGPKTLDHLGSLSWGSAAPIAFLPADPSLSGLKLYGQWAALTPSGFQVLVQLSNGILTQIPWQWGSGRGPGVSTIYAAGAGAHTAQTGTLLLHQGLVVIFGT